MLVRFARRILVFNRLSFFGFGPKNGKWVSTFAFSTKKDGFSSQVKSILQNCFSGVKFRAKFEVALQTQFLSVFASLP